MNLFEDVVFTGTADWTEPTFAGAYSLSGRLVEEPLGSLTFVVNGETVAGTVRKDMAPLDGLDGLTVAGRNDLEPPSPGNGRARRFGSEGDAGR